jgi:hypothetical protein
MGFLAACEHELRNAGPEAETCDHEWLKWASSYASNLDPFTSEGLKGQSTTDSRK